MTLSMFSASVPIFTRMLGNLSHVLDKAQDHADACRFDTVALTQFRLAPDMLPFTRQVLIACDTAKNGVARMSGVEAPKFEDNESTLSELKLRIRKTIDWLETVPPERLNGTEDKDITFPASRKTTKTMKADAILRHNGVELGKGDYLSGADKMG